MSTSPRGWRRLLPKSLLWRIFWLVTALMMLSMSVWYASFDLNVREPRSRHFAQTLLSIINLTRSALIATSPHASESESLLQEMSNREGLRLLRARPDDRVAPLPEGGGLTAVENLLRETEGPGTRVALELNGERGLFVRFRVSDANPADYWLALPRERALHALPVEWINWAAAALALALAGAWLIAWSIRRTLKSLAAAAADIGAGRQPQPVAEDGPAEIAALARAFNHMSKGLAHLDDDRALLLAGVSHDLRTPLTRLRMDVEMSGMDESLRADAVMNIEEMDQTIGQFLDFARGESGEPKEEVFLSALLDELATTYQRRGAQIRHVPSPACANLRFDVRPKALRRAIANLIENALRHGGNPAQVELSLALEQAQAHIDVADRGPGIPPNEVDILKRPFTRRDTARGGVSGAGLGLAIVERIARAHGGALQLLPREGGGLVARIKIAANPAGGADGA